MLSNGFLLRGGGGGGCTLSESECKLSNYVEGVGMEGGEGERGEGCTLCQNQTVSLQMYLWSDCVEQCVCTVYLNQILSFLLCQR